MRHQKRGRKFNRTASHRKAMMSNLASALIIHKRIRTTDAKGKELRGFIDRLITYAKQDNVHARRLIQRRINGKRAKQIAAYPWFAAKKAWQKEIHKRSISVS